MNESLFVRISISYYFQFALKINLDELYFSVRPPKKSWKNISNLSGGEKTLSSLALVSI